jgi:hypothetical protein
MTMRLDIVTNDAGELVRREHARELGAGVVVALYRLVKLAQMHDLGNQAFLRQLEQCHQMIGDYCLRSGSNVSVLFAHKATFVAGQLLKGNRGAYEAAAELGELLERLGGSELHILRDITREDLNAFAEQISLYHRNGNAAQFRIPPRMHLRRVADAARLRGIELENLTPDQRIVRAYASAVVIMRRFFEDLAASRYVLPRRIKRIAQSLVDLSDASTASYLGVTEVRNANYDEAGRAVNTAILAVSIARETTQNRTVLAQIAMAAMMHDVARPRALALAGAAGAPMPGMAGPSTLSEDQEDRLAAGAVAVLTALGRVNEPSITRTVLTFEALWLRRKTWLGPVYWGARPPTLHASIIAVARRYNDLLTPEPGLAPPTIDYAVAMLANELTDAQDRTVLRMLVSALGLLPTGTLVQLSTGEVAEVTRGTKRLGERAAVVIVADANGQPYPQRVEVDLAQDTRRTVLRVLGVDGWRKGLEGGPQAGFDPGPNTDEDIPISSAPAPPPVDFRASGEHPSASMPSLGSSPSAVAEAMGRMINDSHRPPAMLPREADRPDRTVFQPQGLDDVPAPRVEASVSRSPTARGNLSATPLPHVLVYMLDHALTGSVVFEGTNVDGRGPSDDTIYFVNGVPAKIRLCDGIALLGQVLVETGSLEAKAVDQAVEGARRLGILFGEYLVGHDLVSRGALASGLEAQLLRKIAHVANLAPEIQYAFYRDVDLLDGWGGEIAVSHPLNPILASVRHWTDRARVRATLNRIGKHPLDLHPDSELSNLAVSAAEQTVLDAVRAQSMPLQQLFKRQLADEEVVSSLVYSLAVTRQLSFKGQKKGPMAARGTARRSAAPGSGSEPGAPSGAPSPSAPMASGARAAVAVPTSGAKPLVGSAVAPAAEESPRMPMASTSSRVGSSPAQARAATQTASNRMPMPAVRPSATGATRPVAPQIRPIAKKPTTAGLQPDAPSATDAGADAAPESAPDDAKTIARPAPALKDIVAGRSGTAPAQPGSIPRAAPKPAPALPSANDAAKTASSPIAGGPDGNTTGAASVSSIATSGSSAEVGDDGLGEAEAALEAMSNFRLAEAALQRNDMVAAEGYAKLAVDAEPTEADYVVLLAWIRAHGGAPQPIEEAIRKMSRVLIEDPSNEKALFYRGKLLVRTNRLPEALNDFNELLSANPHHRDAQEEVRQLTAKMPS